MSYLSPIEVFQAKMKSQIVGEIYKAVMDVGVNMDKDELGEIYKEAVKKVGVNIDKDELMKALQYDRDQYQKGYADRDSEIILCKDCKHGEKVPTFKYYPDVTWCNKHSTSHNDDWFCADGERQT